LDYFYCSYVMDMSDKQNSKYYAHIYAHMTKTISLSDEAYNLLKSVKRKDESFSDVIKRVIGKKGRLSDVLFMYPELKDAKDFEDAVEEVKKKISRKFEEVLDEMY